jgi:hypothetical protein
MSCKNRHSDTGNYSHKAFEECADSKFLILGVPNSDSLIGIVSCAFELPFMLLLLRWLPLMNPKVIRNKSSSSLCIADRPYFYSTSVSLAIDRLQQDRGNEHLEWDLCDCSGPSLTLMWARMPDHEMGDGSATDTW